MEKIDIYAEIKELRYVPFLCKKLNIFKEELLESALQRETSFILKVNHNQIAISWWVSPKRTRSYPYARVYDTLGFAGKKVTIIPVIKDEGKDGDRDFLQWDTVSLMSLLGVYTIISYYADASKNPKFKNKITQQKFDINHLKSELKKVLNYQSDALHWNLSQIDNVGEICQKALYSYRCISNKLNIEMHSWTSAKERIIQLIKGKENFMRLSRKMSKEAQERERATVQPKEYLKGVKATLTIKNYLGGYYCFTCDEVEIYKNDLYIIEGKHTQTKKLPSSGDLKDGLLRMIIFANLKNATVGEKHYKVVPVLKLTTADKFDLTSLKKEEIKTLKLLCKEAKTNGFKIMLNEKFLSK